MNITVDPERNEINALLEFAGNLEGKRVIEIGAGYGRLTWLYAPLAGEVVAVDPDPIRMARARNEIPEALSSRVSLLETTVEQYQTDWPHSLFDMALMSWSL